MDKEKIFRALWDFYRKRVLPLEIAYQYEHFEGKTMMTEADFMSKPMVLLLGPYSVGKTSFIRSLIKCDFPGAPRRCKSMHRPISNEPTNVFTGLLVTVPSKSCSYLRSEHWT